MEGGEGSSQGRGGELLSEWHNGAGIPLHWKQRGEHPMGGRIAFDSGKALREEAWPPKGIKGKEAAQTIWGVPPIPPPRPVFADGGLS